MKTHLINLVSKQTIPNILFIKEFPGLDEFVFITTQKMENQQKTAAICKVSGLKDEKIKKIETEGESFNRVISDLSNEIPISTKDKYVVNLTGGTKMMALATYKYFKNYDNIDFYYTPIGTNQYYKIGENRRINFGHKLNVEEYLNAYGINIITPPEKRNKLFTTREQTQHFLKQYLKNTSAVKKIDAELRKTNNNVRNDNHTSIDSSLQSQIIDLGIELEKDKKITRYEALYLTGDWFEELIYSFIKDKLGLKDEYIYTGINIQNEKPENEIDVLFTWENKLHVIECKTSIYNHSDEENLSNRTIYKLAALHSNFGLSAHSYIFTLSKRNKNKQSVREIDINRAKVFSGISYFTFEDIINTDTMSVNERYMEENFLEKL